MKTTAGWALVVAVVVEVSCTAVVVVRVFAGGAAKSVVSGDAGFWAFVLALGAVPTAVTAFIVAFPRESPATKRWAATLVITGLAAGLVVLLTALAVLALYARD